MFMSWLHDGARTGSLVPRVLTGRLSAYINDIAGIVNLRSQVRVVGAEGDSSIRVDWPNDESIASGHSTRIS
jgi:hypothetical protein